MSTETQHEKEQVQPEASATDTPEVTPEVRDYFRTIGRIRGKNLVKKHGNSYFKDLAAKRKRHGRQKLPTEGEK